MEHLPYPQRPAVPLSEVPYVCSTQYDCGAFLDYPRRAGLEYIHIDGFIYYDSLHGPKPVQKLEDFFQRWLFFGLLHEIFAEDYNESDFVRYSQDRCYADTTKLSEKLEAWLNTFETCDPQRRDKCSRHLVTCLKMADRSTALLLQEHRADFCRAIRQSIAALGETLSRVIDLAFDPPYGGWQILYLGPRLDGDLKHAMLRNSWCISSALATPKAITSASAMHYWYALAMPDLGRDHALCGTDGCGYLQINKATYKPAHVPDCTCSTGNLVGLDNEGLACLAAALEAGKIPLLKVHGDSPGNVKIAVEESAPGKGYVALSHVWADGLGNPDETELPGCQLLRLRDYVRDLKQSDFRVWNSDEPETRDLLLWVDTICVLPHNSAAGQDHQRWRNLAMESMAEVYKKAAYVLIVDQTLLAYRLADIGELEATMRLFVCPWMTRLWTLQEVVLAQSPLIRFADRAVDLRELWQFTGKRMRQLNISYRALSENLQRAFFQVRIRQFDKPLSFKVGNYAVMLSQRRVSVPSDEALCLCTLLELDLVDVVEAPDDQKMEALWRLVGAGPFSVPKRIIFNKRKRLMTKGLRWAPKTLLGHSDANEILSTLLYNDGGSALSARASPEGLVVAFSAWRVAPSPRPEDFDLSVAGLCEAQVKRISPGWGMVRDERQAWWRVGPSESPHNSGTSAIEVVSQTKGDLVILLTPSISRGLLVEIESWSTQPPCVSSAAIVLLAKVAENEQQLWTAAYARAETLRREKLVPRLMSMILADAMLPNTKLRSTPGWPSIDCDSSDSDLDVVRRFLEADVSESIELIKHYSVAAEPYYAFAWRVLVLYLGLYLTVEETYSEKSEWCVD